MSKRTITGLLADGKKVYIWMADNKVAKQFLQDAEAEGFMFENGAKPTEKETSDIFRIFNKDNKAFMCYVGHVGRMAFQAAKDDTIRVDYKKFASGESDYYYSKESK